MKSIHTHTRELYLHNSKTTLDCMIRSCASHNDPQYFSFINRRLSVCTEL